MSELNLSECVHKHMSLISKEVNNLINIMPGTPTEKEIAYYILIQYYEAMVEYLNTQERMNFVAKTFCEMVEKEKKGE